MKIETDKGRYVDAACNKFKDILDNIQEINQCALKRENQTATSQKEEKREVSNKEQSSVEEINELTNKKEENTIFVKKQSSAEDTQSSNNIKQNSPKSGNDIVCNESTIKIPKHKKITTCKF